RSTLPQGRMTSQDIILRVPRASILGEFHFTLTALFAIRFTQRLNIIRSRRLVLSELFRLFHRTGWFPKTTG
ncbi:MAG: hypothetical protein ACK5T6_00900, partial [Pirellula sp.]